MIINASPRITSSRSSQADFGEYAKDQLDIAVDWGRYAELFAYDEGAGELYLEEDEATKA